VPARAAGRQAQQRGVDTEAVASAALRPDGGTIHAQRLRTAAGEIDLVAEKDGVLASVEVKARATLADAAWVLTAREQGRLLAAAEIVLAEHSTWGAAGVRFDVVVVDATGQCGGSRTHSVPPRAMFP
jgi:putative endonuclease